MLFCSAQAVFHMLILILNRDAEQFKRILNGIKPTWSNIFSQLEETLILIPTWRGGICVFA